MDRSPTNLVLILGAVFSVLVHLGLGYALMAAPSPEILGIDPLSSDPDRELELGIEQSDTVTITWMGFEKPTEHEARKSETDQSAMTTDPTAGGAAAAIGEVAPEPMMTPPQQVMEPAPPQPSESLPMEQPIEVATDDTAEITELSVELIEDQTETPDEDTPDQTQPTDQQAAPSPRQDAQQPRLTTPDPVDQPAEDTQTADSEVPEADNAGESEAEGEAADRESPATSVEEPLEIKPGKTAAQEGLQIVTRRIEWPNIMRTRRPSRNPIVEFYFNRKGEVDDIRFARDEETDREYSSGAPDVDEVLLNNLYKWRAKGAQLEELPEDDKKATLKVVIRILLK